MATTISQYFNLATYAAQKVPGVASAAARHLTLGPKQGQEDCDLRTVVAVALLSSLTADASKATVESVQALSNRITPVPKNLWGIRIKFEIPNGKEVEEAVDNAMASTRPEDIDSAELPKSKYLPCSAEWQSVRKYKGPIDDLDEREKYNLLQEGCTDKEAVLLYFHGGAHYLGNETGHREFVATLAGEFGGKAFSVRYRKSPQQPFPAALTDALAAYEYLISPPRGAIHKAVDPKKIVLAGDSAGGNLASALMIVLLESPRSRWPLPGGLALFSPWVDLTHALPSCRDNGRADYLPEMVMPKGSHRPSEAWKADGKQRQFYCPNTLITHPLVSPLAYDGWGSSPPVLIQCGEEEKLRDEARYLARLVAEEGVAVALDEYRSMPHVFQMLSLSGTMARTSIRLVGEYVSAVTRGGSIVPRRVLRTSRGPAVTALPDSVFRLSTHQQVKSAMREARDKLGAPVKAVL